MRSSSTLPRVLGRCSSRRSTFRPTSDRSSGHRPTSRRLATSTLLALLGVLAAVVLPASAASAAPATVTPSRAIEAHAPYQGQTTCDPVARPGTVALRNLVLATYPGTGDSGIVRACHLGGGSEHKEGRAWDWRVSAANPTHAAQVADFTSWLLAPDEHGNPAAMARRLGIMYMIWDSKVWKSYQAVKGWQPYIGASPHTDHVHFSLSWAGALGKTSYWTGTVAPVMYAPVKAPAATSGASTTGASTLSIAERRLQRRIAVGRVSGPWRRH